ncbi:MAG TPA: hypothetical protein VGX22_02940 [Candidatus Dormibacteraeota bacterium]|nr:hypothetical protein [Candidatus Dormibacteraeota bacterium]
MARVVFWVTTNRMFEDGLTTITFARNVPLGLGLVHHTGEGHIHGFTSALGVLIPLAGELVHEGAGMTAMRLASLGAVCVALIYARFLCRDLGIGAFPTAFVLAYLAFDQNMIFFGMSGMETQVAVAILLAGVYHVRRSDFVAAGICLGLAPLARPEFVLWVAPALLYLLLINRRRAVVSAVIAAAIVLPWIVFTTLYYGSPIPNTIVAKNNIYPIPAFVTDGSVTPWLSWLGSQLAGHTVILLYKLEPFREVWSTALTPIPDPVLVAIAIAVVYFLVLGLVAARSRRDMWPAIGFLGLFLAYRVYFIPAINYYDWYLPPFLGLAMIVVAMGMQRMSASISLAPKTVAVALSVAFAVHMPFSFAVEAGVQSVEDHVRTNVGLYLNANVQPGESVLSESAGYIGFYGGQKLYDYPGLTSKVSVHALQALPPDRRGIADLIAVLQPDWLVLRPWELDSLRARFPDVASRYEAQKVFEMPGIPERELDMHGASGVEFAGYAQVNIDMKFTVLKRTG